MDRPRTAQGRTVKSVVTHRVSPAFIDLATLTIMRMSREAGEFLAFRKCATRSVERLRIDGNSSLESSVRRYSGTDWRGSLSVNLALTEAEAALFTGAREGLNQRFGSHFNNLDAIVLAMFAYLALPPGTRL